MIKDISHAATRLIRIIQKGIQFNIVKSYPISSLSNYVAPDEVPARAARQSL